MLRRYESALTSVALFDKFDAGFLFSQQVNCTTAKDMFDGSICA